MSALALVLGLGCGGDDGPAPEDHAPTVDDASVSTPEDVPLTVTIGARDEDGDPVSIEVEPPSNGTLTVSGLTVTYTPAENTVGTEELTVTVTAGGLSDSAVLQIMVTPVNDPPLAVDDVRAANEDQVQSVPVAALLANDRDPDGDTLTVTAVDDPSGGTVALAGSDIEFTPVANFSGDATFAYTITDGQATVAATVTLQFGAVNDAPVAVDDGRSTAEDAALVVAGASLVANDTDAEGQTLAVIAVNAAVNGTVSLAAGSVTFTPAANFNGTASFQYTVSDGAASATGLVTVTVTAVNDDPVAVDDGRATAEDAALVVAGASLVANDADVEGQVLTVTAVGAAVNGAVSLTAGSVTFTPIANFNGAASFEYAVSDGAASDTGLVTVTVTAVNDAPVAVGDGRTTVEDAALLVAGASLVANDTDVEGQTLTVTAVNAAVNGTVSLAAGSVTFTPAANFNGTASFQYTVSDGAASAAGLVTVAVTAVNDAPVAVNDSRSTNQNTAVVITSASLLANDTDVEGQALTVTAVTNASDGTVSLAGGTVTFTPTAGFTGSASFEYTVSDGAASDTGLVTVVVSAPGTIAQLSGGNAHMCARSFDGAVKCWGLNAYGNLGLGDTNKRGDQPNEMGTNLPEVELGTGRTAVTLAGGGEHSCALLDNGTVKCWGYNFSGQLGLGNTASRGTGPGQMGDILPPINLGAGRTVVQMDGGAEHSCAVLDNGSLKCWGGNGNGQLGLGDTSNRGDNANEMGDNLPAVNLGTGRTALQVSAGGGHTCALLDDLTVKCWGSNFRGQLGLGDTSNRGDNANEMGDNLPAVALGAGLVAGTLALGEIHSCVLFANNTVKCWGFGSFGALGLGDSSDRGGAPGEMGNNLPAVALGTGRSAISIAVGHHTCALLDNLDVKCWGYNDFGQLGQGNTSWLGSGPGQMGNNLSPVNFGTGLTADAVVTMLYNTCVLTDDDLVKCWGGNLNGQLGQGDNIYRGDEPGEMGNGLPFIDIW